MNNKEKHWLAKTSGYWTGPNKKKSISIATKKKKKKKKSDKSDKAPEKSANLTPEQIIELRDHENQDIGMSKGIAASGLGYTLPALGGAMAGRPEVGNAAGLGVLAGGTLGYLFDMIKARSERNRLQAQGGEWSLDAPGRLGNMGKGTAIGATLGGLMGGMGQYKEEEEEKENKRKDALIEDLVSRG